MSCEHVAELMAFEIPHYKEKLRERKEYFDKMTGCDVWDYLVERDFQKRFFLDWAEHEKIEFCSKYCIDRDGCDSWARRN